eukprot:s6242_g1.t1
MLQTLSKGLTRPNFGSPGGTPLEGIGLNLAAFEGFGAAVEVSTAFGVEAACAKEEWSGGGGGGERSGPSNRFLWAGLPTATAGASWVPLGGWAGAGSGEGTDGSRGGGGGGSGVGGGGGGDGGRGVAALPVPTVPYGPLSLSPCLIGGFGPHGRQ